MFEHLDNSFILTSMKHLYFEGHLVKDFSKGTLDFWIVAILNYSPTALAMGSLPI